MKKQSILQQLGIGAFIGVVLAAASHIRQSNPEPLLSSAGLGVMLGGAIGGVLIYVLAYQVWHLWLGRQ
jgi:hypothetical protein